MHELNNLCGIATTNVVQPVSSCSSLHKLEIDENAYAQCLFCQAAYPLFVFYKRVGYLVYDYVAFILK